MLHPTHPATRGTYPVPPTAGGAAQPRGRQRRGHHGRVPRRLRSVVGRLLGPSHATPRCPAGVARLKRALRAARRARVGSLVGDALGVGVAGERTAPVPAAGISGATDDACTIHRLVAAAVVAAVAALTLTLSVPCRGALAAGPGAPAAAGLLPRDLPLRAAASSLHRSRAVVALPRFCQARPGCTAVGSPGRQRSCDAAPRPLPAWCHA